MDKIYEAVDVTDEDTYFSMGFFNTKKDAVNAIKAAVDPYFPLTDHAEDGYEKIEVREHKVGLNDDFKTVYKLERNAELNKDIGEYIWNTGRN